MKLFQYIVGLLLALCLTSTASLYITNHFINADYFYATAEESSLNQAVSEIITTSLVDINESNGSTIPPEALDQALSSTVATQYLESKNHEITEELEQVLRGKKDTIKVSFDDLADTSQTAGLNVTAVDIAPLEITPPKEVTQQTGFFLQRLEFFLFISVLSSAVLLVVSVILAIKTGSRTPLIIALFITAILCGLVGLFIGSLDLTTINSFALPETLNPLQAPLQNFIGYIADDIRRWYQVAGAGLFVATSLLGVIEFGILQRTKKRDSYKP